MSCKKENDIAKIEFNKYVNFGTIKVGDTINEVFVIKNISSNILKINEIKTSCGCTIAKINDSIVNSKSSTNINVTFIAEKGDVGIIEKSIVLDTNTKPNFNVIYLKGKVIN
jgi:hypothetical protein